MTASLWVTLIIGVATPVCTLLGVIIANNRSNKKQSDKIDESNQKQAEKVDEYKNLTIYRIEQLEAKQDKHNNHTERLYKLEGKVKEIAEEMATVREHLLNNKK